MHLESETGLYHYDRLAEVKRNQRPGAAIEGEAGVGSGLKPGFPLPPLMFTLEAIEALGTHNCSTAANLLISQGKTSAARGGGDTGETDGDDLSGLL